MKKHLKYLQNNIDNDARIIIPFLTGGCMIYPSFQVIQRKTAIAIVNKSELVSLPAYMDHRNHDIGATMFVFRVNVSKY